MKIFELTCDTSIWFEFNVSTFALIANILDRGVKTNTGTLDTLTAIEVELDKLKHGLEGT